jgi:hypothetical protein
MLVLEFSTLPDNSEIKAVITAEDTIEEITRQYF